jgi:glycosyltransferase involved in cell wall biosynthesis
MPKLRIAQVAPLFESVPPRGYGGTERVVSYLTEELVRTGHDVTLFASGDSVTAARLVATRTEALRLDPAVRDWIPHHLVMLEELTRRIREFDVVHFHVDLLHLPLIRRLGVPSLTTLHGRLDLPDLPALYTEFTEPAFASISLSQRAPLPGLKWATNVYHGLPLDLYGPGPGDGGYFAFLGRISREKGPDQAIEIAKRAGVRLKIAAKVDVADREYFESEIEPLLDHPLLEFIGEVSDAGKQEFLGHARGLLFPIDWPEPFGMVMIEAMACGTPVIARPRGSVPEVMVDGVTGYLFEELDEAVEHVRKIDDFDRARCRRHFEEHFSASRMAQDYTSAYRELIGPTSQRGPKVVPRALRRTG